jgi:DNA-binding HxlR family transcriptional regulator
VTSRTYGQYCPIAHALDVVGDRWNLLILRELSFGPQRFTDLRSALAGIAPNLLADRLRDLEEAGVVAREELPPPAARTVYALTEAGRDVRPVLAALARFGARRLPAPEAGTPVRPAAALAASITAFHDPLAAVGFDELYRVTIDGRRFDLRCNEGRLRLRADGAEPDLTLDASSATLLAVRQGRLSLEEAVAAGDLVVDGPKRALQHFRQAFAFPPA